MSSSGSRPITQYEQNIILKGNDIWKIKRINWKIRGQSNDFYKKANRICEPHLDFDHFHCPDNVGATIHREARVHLQDNISKNQFNTYFFLNFGQP